MVVCDSGIGRVTMRADLLVAESLHFPGPQFPPCETGLPACLLGFSWAPGSIRCERVGWGVEVGQIAHKVIVVAHIYQV